MGKRDGNSVAQIINPYKAAGSFSQRHVNHLSLFLFLHLSARFLHFSSSFIKKRKEKKKNFSFLFCSAVSALYSIAIVSMLTTSTTSVGFRSRNIEFSIIWNIRLDSNIRLMAHDWSAPWPSGVTFLIFKNWNQILQIVEMTWNLQRWQISFLFIKGKFFKLIRV